MTTCDAIPVNSWQTRGWRGELGRGPRSRTFAVRDVERGFPRGKCAGAFRSTRWPPQQAVNKICHGRLGYPEAAARLMETISGQMPVRLALSSDGSQRHLAKKIASPLFCFFRVDVVECYLSIASLEHFG